MTGTLLTLHDPAAAERYYAAGLWRRESHYHLMARHATERAGDFALRDSARRLTWGELHRWVDAVADDLHESGLRRGERVSVWVSNRAEAVVAYLACSRNGYVCNPSLHRNYTVEEIVHLLREIRSSAAIVEEGWGTDTDRHDPFLHLADLGRLRKLYRLPRGRSSGHDLPGPEAGPRGLAPPVEGGDKVCYLAFTSGTTGKPKGVMHSDNTLLANCRDLVARWGHDHRSRLYTISPLSHHIAWVAVGQAMVAGMELIVDDPPKGKTRLDWLVETGATYVMGVPTHAMDILAEQRRRAVAGLGACKVFYMAGSPIPPAVCEAFLAQGVTPQNIYGMTENSSHQFTHPDDPAEIITRTCGRGGPAYEVRLFRQDDPDREAGAGEVGQIAGKGACLMLGYFDNQAATEDSFNRDGWFLSGDLGRLDEAGNLAVVGRLKDVIIRGGHNVHPARIEDLAVKHPAVAKAAAFGVADERLGEKVCLAVLAEGIAPTADQVLEHLFAAGLSKYDMPEYFLVMESFPLTASGKILKRELAAWTRAGRLSPAPCRFVEPAKRGVG